MSDWRTVRTISAALAAAAVALAIPTAARTQPAGVRVPPTASPIIALDPVRPMPPGARPLSAEPVAGIAFVRCTRLWTALPDGSQERRIMEMEGISSPAFSPDGRTIAFLATGEGGQEIWMTAADGSAALPVAPLRSGGLPVPATASGLVWSPDGDRLAFALAAADGASSVWTLHLASGELRLVAGGASAPAWLESGLFASTGAEPRIAAVRAAPTRAASGVERRLAGGLLALAAATAPGDSVTAGPVVALLLATEPGEVELHLKARMGSRRTRQVSPPAGYSISDGARVAVAQDGATVLVDLVDRSGEPSIGALDVASGAWSVSEYAWEPAASPVPVAGGPLEARRATRAALEVLREAVYRQGARAPGLLAGGRPAASLVPFRHGSFVLGPAAPGVAGWTVPAIVYGRSEVGFGYRRLSVRVLSREGRLLARTAPLGGPHPVGTVGEAAALLGELLGADIAPPAVLPPGAELARWPVSAWDWTEPRGGELSLRYPARGGGRAFLTLQYGQASFSLGCGGPEDVVPVEVGDEPGLLGRLGRDRQVIWPATEEGRPAAHGVYGRLPEEALLAIAASIPAPIPA